MYDVWDKLGVQCLGLCAVWRAVECGVLGVIALARTNGDALFIYCASTAKAGHVWDGVVVVPAGLAWDAHCGCLLLHGLMSCRARSAGPGCCAHARVHAQ